MTDIKRLIGWARRGRLTSFKRLGAHFDAAVRSMFEYRSNTFVKAMNGLDQQTKRTTRGFKNAATFIGIAYLSTGKLTHLPTSRFAAAMPRTSADGKSSSMGNDKKPEEAGPREEVLSVLGLEARAEQAH